MTIKTNSRINFLKLRQLTLDFQNDDEINYEQECKIRILGLKIDEHQLSQRNQLLEKQQNEDYEGELNGYTDDMNNQKNSAKRNNGSLRIRFDRLIKRIKKS